MQASPADMILVAGKGHEDYQIVGTRRLDYSDRLTVARLWGDHCISASRNYCTSLKAR